LSNLKPWEISQKIDNALEAIAISKVDKFYHSYIAKMTNLPLGVVIDTLSELEKKEALVIKLEFYCEECSRNILTANKSDLENIDAIPCKYCGTEISLDPLNAIPIIKLSDDFRQSFSKKKLITKRKMSG
jgi:DNA-directed RNA polymerase subunit RPC12/RpoP